jgi:ribosome-associated heat shock protein Hsp15
LNKEIGIPKLSNKVRLDKWLWACRFYKTRALAKKEIEGGRVQVNGQKAKSSKELSGGELVCYWKGWDQCTVEVLQLSDQRRSAAEVAARYRETEASLAEREKRAAERRAQPRSNVFTESRPNKKQRRQIHRFQRKISDD